MKNLLDASLRVLFGISCSCSLYESAATANLTMELRAGAVSGGGMISSDRSVVGVFPGSAITLEVWAAIDNVGSIETQNTFGIQRVIGSIISAPLDGSPSLRGHMSPATLFPPFNTTGSAVGTVQELTMPADGSFDLGSNATSSSIQYITFRSDITSVGQQIGTGASRLITNNVPVGTVYRPIPHGYEFLLGEASYTVEDVFDPAGQGLALNWVIPPFTAVAPRATRAQWTQGDGAVYNGHNQAALMFTGMPVTISPIAALVVVPEVTNWNLLAGGIGLLACGRQGGVASDDSAYCVEFALRIISSHAT